MTRVVTKKTADRGFGVEQKCEKEGRELRPRTGGVPDRKSRDVSLKKMVALTGGPSAWGGNKWGRWNGKDLEKNS